MDDDNKGSLQDLAASINYAHQQGQLAFREQLEGAWGLGDALRRIPKEQRSRLKLACPKKHQPYFETYRAQGPDPQTLSEDGWQKAHVDYLKCLVSWMDVLRPKAPMPRKDKAKRFLQRHPGLASLAWVALDEQYHLDEQFQFEEDS